MPHDGDCMDRDNKIAVLVDAENVSEKYAQDLLDEVTNYGIPTYKRVYGDWTKPQLSNWKNSLLTYSFTPIQQYSYTTGKNSSDSAMIIDAMDILYSGKVTGFCLVTSDSDFTRLAMRLREAGMLVLGMGEKKTPQPFIKACEKFIYLEVLKNAEEKTEEKLDGKSDKVEKEDQDKKEKKGAEKPAVSSVVPLKRSGRRSRTSSTASVTTMAGRTLRTWETTFPRGCRTLTPETTVIANLPTSFPP